MTLIINPGARIPDDAVNTYERAQRYAQEWFDQIHKDGFGDIEMIDTGEHDEGRWKFLFRHTVTGVEVRLDQHGIDHPPKMAFPPRVYWNGSSSAVPRLEDFAADGFVMTFRPEESR